MGSQAPSWPRRGGSLVAGVMMECPGLTDQGRAEQMHFPGTRASEFIGPVKHNEQITGYIYFAFTFMRVLNHIHDP